MSLRSAIEYLGEWEMLYNPDFRAAGSNNFVLSVKTWLERTNAISIRSKAGRYGGTYAHKDMLTISVKDLFCQQYVLTWSGGA